MKLVFKVSKEHKSNHMYSIVTYINLRENLHNIREKYKMASQTTSYL
jgi:hypothetical protein